MSFCIDLWNGFDIIKSHFLSTLNKTNTTYSMLTSYANYEKDFANHLENLYSNNKDLIKDPKDSFLDLSLQKLIDNFKAESDYHKEHSEYIIKYVSTPLKESYDEIKSSVQNLFSENSKNFENYSKMTNNIISTQKKYHGYLKDLQTFLLSLTKEGLEDYITNYKQYVKEQQFKEKEEPENNLEVVNNIKSERIKKHKLIDKIFASKADYISSISDANEDIENYNTKSEKILTELESKYMKLINSLQNTLFNVTNNKLLLLQNIIKLNDVLIETKLNKIKLKNELMNFIMKNATKEFPIFKFEFICYKLDRTNANFEIINKFLNDNNLNSNDSDSIFAKYNRKCSTKLVKSSSRKSFNIKKKQTENTRNVSVSKMNTKYSSEMNEFKLKTNTNLIEDFIDELDFNKDEDKKKDNNINIKNNNNLDKNENKIDINQIKSLLTNLQQDKNIYLETIIKSLNYYRSKGYFLLSKLSYDYLIDIFKFLLDTYSTSDFLLKNILILAQTFYIYKEGDINKKNKIFLQQGLKNYPIFSKPETWHRVINYTLYVNIINKDLTQKIDKNSQNSKLSLLAFNTLVSYLSDLTYFTDDDNVFYEVKDFYAIIYQLDIKAIDDQLNAILGDKIKNKVRGSKGINQVK